MNGLNRLFIIENVDENVSISWGKNVLEIIESNVFDLVIFLSEILLNLLL